MTVLCGYIGMMVKATSINAANKALQAKYAMTAWWYDLLDYPWERQYRRWRPAFVGDLEGNVLEAGVGTGRNLEHYSASVNLTGIELSKAMLKKARRRSRKAKCVVSLVQEDATLMTSILSGHLDWVILQYPLSCVASCPTNSNPLPSRNSNVY